MTGSFPENPPRVTGGVQAVTWQLASALADRGVQVDTFSSERFWREPHPRGKRWSRQHGAIHSVYRQSNPKTPHVANSFTEDAWATRAAARAAGPDVVHGHGQDGSSLGALFSGLPCVITPHGLLFREKSAQTGARRLSPETLRQESWTRLESLILGRAKHVIVISPYVREQLEPQVNGEIHTIENPIGDEFFIDPVLPEGPPALLTIGWLQPRKRQELLIRAVAEAREQVPGLRLIVVGGVSPDSAEHADMLRRLPGELGIGDAVEFLSDLSEEEMLEQYRRCTVYVHSAMEESSPMVVLQAMSAARPVVAVDIPGVRHLVADGETGRRVESTDPTVFAAALVETLLDRPGLQRMSANARAGAERRFRSSSVAEQTEAVYVRAIEQWRSGRRR